MYGGVATAVQESSRGDMGGGSGKLEGVQQRGKGFRNCEGGARVPQPNVLSRKKETQKVPAGVDQGCPKRSGGESESVSGVRDCSPGLKWEQVKVGWVMTN